jgi:exosome complex RNA-binding protein Rrp42 (RNase PH superfamily)
MYKIEDLKVKKEIEDQIENFIFKGINIKDLQVNQDNNEFFWKLYVDLYVMDVLKLSIFQFIGLGVKLLLKNLNLPKIIVFQNKLNGENEFDLLENYEDLSQNQKMRSFNNIDIPDIYCLGILRNTVILDPSEEEFSVIESIIFVSQLNGEVQNIQSIGSSIDLSKIQQITNIVKNINKTNNKMEEC